VLLVQGVQGVVVGDLDDAEDITWIDHHKSAAAFDYGAAMAGIRDFTESGKSGALLAWKYFFPEEMIPEAVMLVSDYDTWTHTYAPRDTQFKEGLTAAGAEPTSKIWGTLLDPDDPDTIVRLCDVGRHIVRFREVFTASMNESYGYDVEFHGMHCRAFNMYGMGSGAFGDMIDTYDACIAYIRTNKTYSVSMYTSQPGIDVSKICVEHGGGGHTQAAGFTCSELPF